jgi:hypothetical protein
MRRAKLVMQRLRICDAKQQHRAGTHSARSDTMRPEERWTIPLHVIMWTVMAVGLIMAMAVVMMH